jgi:hypothetical protein
MPFVAHAIERPTTLFKRRMESEGRTGNGTACGDWRSSNVKVSGGIDRLEAATLAGISGPGRA